MLALIHSVTEPLNAGDGQAFYLAALLALVCLALVGAYRLAFSAPRRLGPRIGRDPRMIPRSAWTSYVRPPATGRWVSLGW
jgi:hypothetical protein